MIFVIPLLASVAIQPIKSIEISVFIRVCINQETKVAVLALFVMLETLVAQVDLLSVGKLRLADLNRLLSNQYVRTVVLVIA